MMNWPAKGDQLFLASFSTTEIKEVFSLQKPPLAFSLGIAP
jgi:hypothetical protein